MIRLVALLVCLNSSMAIAEIPEVYSRVAAQHQVPALLLLSVPPPRSSWPLSAGFCGLYYFEGGGFTSKPFTETPQGAPDFGAAGYGSVAVGLHHTNEKAPRPTRKAALHVDRGALVVPRRSLRLSRPGYPSSYGCLNYWCMD